MPVNANRPERWKEDIAQSVDLYNHWFMQFAPQVYQHVRVETTKQVQNALAWPDILRQYPSILAMLRMTTAPPLARDRLIGLSGVLPHVIRSMELQHQLPVHMDKRLLDEELQKIGNTIMRLVDADIFPWLQAGKIPTETEIYRAATIVADRLCGVAADPIIRNAQEQRQLEVIKLWLERRGYIQVTSNERVQFDKMKPGTFSFRLNVQ